MVNSTFPKRSYVLEKWFLSAALFSVHDCGAIAARHLANVRERAMIDFISCADFEGQGPDTHGAFVRCHRHKDGGFFLQWQVCRRMESLSVCLIPQETDTRMTVSFSDGR